MKMLSLNNYCVLSVLVTLLKIQAVPFGINMKATLPLDETYYKNCAPPMSCDENAKYRTINGSCNNLLNPLWGSTVTPYVRLVQANYEDDDHMIRFQSNGKELPGSRQVTVAIFLSKSFDVPDFRNFHLNQVGQWVTHDISLMLPDFSGDLRGNQHYGLVVYNTIFVRFHNYLVDELLKCNPSWTDEILYQEARKIVIAVHQILIYRDYLPVLLGEAYSAEVGLTVVKGKNTVYNPKIMSQIAVDFTAGCFRVPHNAVPSKFYFLDKNNQVTSEVLLNEAMSFPDPIVEGTNFEDILRGMSTKPGRFPISSYNLMISNFMFHGFLPANANQDLLSIDIQRGRDVGLPSYTAIREFCGFPKVASFDDLLDTLSIFDVALLKSLYADVTDVDLLVGALLEPLAPDATVGPTARCVLTDAFYRLRYGDRFFFDVQDQPGSFTPEQLDVLWSLDIPKIFCGMSTVNEMPSNLFMANGYSDVLKCEPLKLDLKAWTSA